MPARARTSGAVRVRSRPSKRMRPDRGRSRPMMLLSSVVLPTPLRPMRQTSWPAPTSKSTPRKMSVSPYDTCSCSIWSIAFAVLAEVHLDHFRVALHFRHRALAEDAALVQHRHAAGDLPHERHVVVNDEQRVLAG